MGTVETWGENFQVEGTGERDKKENNRNELDQFDQEEHSKVLVKWIPKQKDCERYSLRNKFELFASPRK